MCTITTQTEPIELSKDLTVYKLVKINFDNDLVIKSMFTSYVDYPVKINQIDNADFTFDKRNENKFTCFDDIETSHYYVRKGTVRKKYKGKIKSIECGFHSVLKKDRLSEAHNDWGDEYIVKCIIPKGSLVYYGKTNLIVSNKIIITDEVIEI